MCSPATCRKCRKTTWSGCGKHVTQVMSTVPTAQRCTCDSNPTGVTPAVRSRGAVAEKPKDKRRAPTKIGQMATGKKIAAKKPVIKKAAPRKPGKGIVT